MTNEPDVINFTIAVEPKDEAQAEKIKEMSDEIIKKLLSHVELILNEKFGSKKFEGKLDTEEYDYVNSVLKTVEENESIEIPNEAIEDFWKDL